MFRRKKRGQAILEYILVLTGLVAAFFVIKTTIQNSTTTMLTNVAGQAEKAVNNIQF